MTSDETKVIPGWLMTGNDSVDSYFIMYEELDKQKARLKEELEKYLNDKYSDMIGKKVMVTNASTTFRPAGPYYFEGFLVSQYNSVIPKLFATKKDGSESLNKVFFYGMIRSEKDINDQIKLVV